MRLRRTPLIALVATTCVGLLFFWANLGPGTSSGALERGVGLPIGQGDVRGAASLERLQTPALDDSRAGAVRGQVRVLGHVEDASDGTRLADWHLALWSDQGVHGSALSGEDGSFVLLASPPISEGAGPFVTAAAPDGWQVLRDTHSLEMEVDGSLRPLVVLGRRSTDAVLARTLVDADTGELVPFFEVLLERDGWGSISCASDSRGRLASPRALPRGPLLVHSVDHPLLDGARHLAAERISLGAGAAGATLPVRVGPTFRLNLVIPRGAGAAVGGRSIEQLAHDLSASVRRAEHGLGAWSLQWHAPVRTAGSPPGDQGVVTRPWLRLRPFDLLFPFDDPESDGPYVIEFTDLAGEFFGSAQLPSTSGIQSVPLDVHLGRLGSVRGRVLDAEGGPLAGATVTLFVAAGAGRGAVPVDQKTSVNGVFDIDRVGAGEHVLRVYTRRHGALMRAVAVAAGEHVEIELRLVPCATGRVAGVARTASGNEPPWVSLHLTPLDEAGEIQPGLSIRRSLDHGDLGSPARFDFGELPQGAYELDIRSWGGPPWEPRRLVVQAPNDSIELFCRDDVRELPLAVDGQSVPRYLRATIGGRILSRAMDGERIDLPTTRPAEIEKFALLEAGKRPLRGDGWTLSMGRSQPFLGALVVKAQMREGWGRVVFVHEQGEPLVGVAVRLDGLRVAATEIDGGVLVEAAQAPARVTLDLPGFRVNGPTDDGFEVRYQVERE